MEDCLVDDKQTVDIKILFFAKARELVGVKESNLKIPKTTCSNYLKNEIIIKFGLESIKDNFVLAIEEEFVEDNKLLDLADNSIVAVIPPLSGGKNSVKIQDDVLSVDEITKIVMAPSCGAVSSFIGTTRDTFNSQEVMKLSYEAYQDMALKKMNVICNEIREKWNVFNIAIHHRIGDVPVGEISVVIAVSSVHRNESLKAVEYAIDRLKQTVPIWKKEIYKNQQAEWKENKECLWKFYDKMSLDDDDNVLLKNNNDYYEINEKFIQVKSTSEEVKMRIDKFTSRKREEINNINIKEFRIDGDVQDEETCARTHAVFVRRKDSKSHLRVTKVENKRGPQTMRVPDNCSKLNDNINSGIDERLGNCEKFIGINKPVPRDIYQRLKNIEDQIFYLEGISPEYRNFLVIIRIFFCDYPKEFDC
ncbi:hypothetical protein HCN44_010793, partial [Aphidius gifuensis]